LLAVAAVMPVVEAVAVLPVDKHWEAPFLLELQPTLTLIPQLLLVLAEQPVTVALVMRPSCLGMYRMLDTLLRKAEV